MLTPYDDFTLQLKAAKSCARDLKINPDPSLIPIKIALLASNTVDSFAEILTYWLTQEGYAAKIWIAPFDTISSTILDRGSALYEFKPDLVWLFTTHRDVRGSPQTADETAVAVAGAIEEKAALWRVLQSELNCTIIQNNADLPPIDPFGNFAGQIPWSRRNLLSRYNLELAVAAPADVVIFDLDHLSAQFGKKRWTDNRSWHHSKNPFHFDAYGLVAFQVARVVAASRGRARKCIALDLDNTLWGGVIGDDGLAGIKLGGDAEGESFADFQRYLRSLKERGIILAVCSKNDEANAQEPFLKHPDCVLKLEDISVFRANWENKADNLRAIATTLNIGLDSIVFVDDNPVERNLVRELLPMVAVPELPEDPAEYKTALAEGRYFETIAFSDEDRQRTRYYRENAARADLQSGFTDIDAYLESLTMTGESGSLDAFHLPRVAQLINKSNQFHLTGTRYSEAELQEIAARPHYHIRHFKLRDRFGDNGLIAALVVNASPGGDLLIDTWAMSCRVLARTMEEFILNDLIALGRHHECASILGRYVPLPKNKLVAKLYERLGFTLVADENGATLWRLALDRPPLPTHVHS